MKNMERHTYTFLMPFLVLCFISFFNTSCRDSVYDVTEKNIVHHDDMNMDFVYFMADNFLMGCPVNPPLPWATEESAQPERMIHLSAFFISKYPITVQQFSEYLNDVGMKDDQMNKRVALKCLDQTIQSRFIPKQGMQSRPMAGVTYSGAVAFCDWYGNHINQKCRLPTEAEWEYVARGNTGRIYPWGNEIKRVHVLYHDIGRHHELATPDGVYDLNGPVAQWCFDKFDSKFYEKSSVSNPVNLVGDGTERFILRGGPMMRYGKDEKLIFPAGWKRFAEKNINTISENVGFRVVLEIK